MAKCVGKTNYYAYGRENWSIFNFDGRSDCVEIIDWIRENLDGFFSIETDTETTWGFKIYIQNANDAMRFKLTWVGYDFRV